MADKHFSRRFTIGGTKPSGFAKPNPIKPDHDISLNISNNDITLQYNKYLENLMMGVIAEKKIREQQQQIMCELATVAKERDDLESEIFKLKLREIDINKLFETQKKLSAEDERLTQLYNKANFKTVLEVLNHLHCILQPFDKLCCENITIPNTPEEWNQVEETLKKTSNTLKSITNVIGNKEQMYKDAAEEIDEFIQIFGKVDGLHKRCTETLYQLQQVVLKDGSVSLSHQENE